ncbi:hypothetical protein [Billgrantia antri]|uniref:hypothetical protein n=1 Tax=Billgrantia antri TaxID=2846777 RepID=UPI003B22099B
MPRTPTTIRVAPSRLAWGCQWLLALAVTGAVLVHAPDWLTLPAVAWLVALGVWLWRGQPRGELLMQPETDGGWRWSWRREAAAEAVSVRLRCVYLGPWLIALDIDQCRTWLWPDSASRESLRQVRRALAR